MKVLSRQSVFDLAIQQCGCIEAAFDIAQLNNISITDDLLPGQELLMPTAVDTKTATYYAINGITPATAIIGDTLFMRIFDKTFDNSFE